MGVGADDAGREDGGGRLKPLAALETRRRGDAL